MALTLVQTKNGLFKGLPSYSNRVSVFKGIPYAKPPVGELRWKEPQPVEPWTGIYYADSYRAMPCQVIEGEEALFYGKGIWPAQEDCLYLNVWTPAEKPGEKLPVLVWIYGGSYRTGSITNLQVNGEGFAMRGVVMVSFNYRVGPIGFLCHPELATENDRNICGNYGTLDQIEALKWVHENIDAFGGDPERITLIGQSAGAHSVMTMCTTPLTKGYFQQAIIQSTAGLSAMYYQDEQSMEDAEQEGIEYLAQLGVSSIKEARKLDAMEITKKLIFAKTSTKAPWFPKTDGYVLPLGTISSIMSGAYHKVHFLCGSNCSETGNMTGFLSKDPNRISWFANTFFKDDPEGYLKTVHAETESKVLQTVFEQYNNDKLTALLGWQALEASRGGNNFYQYYYTKPLPGPENYGACHGAELPYVFETMKETGRPFDGSDYDLSKTITAYWTNFIKTGNPNGEGLPTWEKYDSKKDMFMELGKSVGMIKVPWNEQRHFIVDYMLKQAWKILEN
ncbi:MAG: carboxylesterase family protein [Eubacteriales bacterium]|nr:carboxylesterase family protein [Eubacteriales bacterium]